MAVVAESTGQSKWKNTHASLRNLRISDNKVDERTKYLRCEVGEPVWGEHYMDCVGSVVAATASTLFTHHFGDDMVRKQEIFQAFGEIERAVPYVQNGVAVIWRKRFSENFQDRPYKQASEMWFNMLANLYVMHAAAVYDMVFEEWKWPLSAYFDGGQTLTMVANMEDYEKLITPKITRLK